MSKHLSDRQLLAKCAAIVARQRATMEVMLDQNSAMVTLAETVLASLEETTRIVQRRQTILNAATVNALRTKMIEQYRRRGQLIDSIKNATAAELTAILAEYGEQEVRQCLELSRGWREYCRAVLWNQSRGGPTVESLGDALRLLHLWYAQAP